MRPLFSHCVRLRSCELRRRYVRKELPFAGYSVVKDPPPPPRGFGETSSRLHVARLAFVYAALAGLPSHSQDDSALSNHTSGWRRLVENTGLEPVTSWLQTRRSPS